VGKPRGRREQALRNLSDDGLHTPDIAAHSLEKIRRHNYFAEEFANSMKGKWARLVYLGLYSGSGRARLEGTGEILETTALSALRLPFTDYVFVDNDIRCVDALKVRSRLVAPEKSPIILLGDVDSRVADVKAAIGPSQGVLCFCFVDPFSAKLKIETIRELSRYKMDFLILLALGHDVRRNFASYYRNPADTTIASLIGDPDWRSGFGQGGHKPVRFVLEKFDRAMTELGYRTPPAGQHFAVKWRSVLLYYLAFYSRSELGERFWKQALKGAASQLELGLDS